MKGISSEIINDPAHKRRFVRLKRSRLTDTADQQGFKVGFACEREDREKSYRLVYERYRDVGLIHGPPGGMWFTVYHALPNSRTAVALMKGADGSPVSTSTLIEDSEIGLPSDTIYKDKIDALRQKGRRVAEVSCLAALPVDRGRNSFLHVFRLMGLYCLYRGVDDLIISVHPKHTQFYQDILLFEPIGEMRYYPYLKDAPAVLEHLEMRTAPERYQRTFSHYPSECNMALFMLGKDLIYLKRLEELIGSLDCKNSMSYNDFFYFFVEKKPIWQEIDAKKRTFFEKLYPGLTAFIKRRLNKN